jgi:hypothetical protein
VAQTVHILNQGALSNLAQLCDNQLSGGVRLGWSAYEALLSQFLRQVDAVFGGLSSEAGSPPWLASCADAFRFMVNWGLTGQGLRALQTPFFPLMACAYSPVTALSTCPIQPYMWTAAQGTPSPSPPASSISTLTTLETSITTLQGTVLTAVPPFDGP